MDETAPPTTEQHDEQHLRKVGRSQAWILGVAAVVLALAEIPLLAVEDPAWPVQTARAILLGGLVVVLGTGFILAGRSLDALRRSLGSLRTTETLLRESEEAKQVILDALPDQMLRLKREGSALTIHMASAAAPRVHALSPRSWPRLAQVALPYVDQALADHAPQEFGFQVEGSSASPVHYQVRLVASSEQEVLAMISDVSERRFLEQRLLDAAARERERIGRDLHDGLCQHLAGTTLVAKTLLGRAEKNEDVSEDELRRLSLLIEDATGESRAIARGMIPVTVERLGVASALEQLARDLENLHDIPISADVDVGTSPPSDPQVALQLFRIAQEAMTNAIKHAEPYNIALTVRPDEEGQALVMEITDDGKGIDPAKLRADSMGLRIMDYRARLIGAFLKIGPGEEGGTTVRCRVATVPEVTVADESRPIVIN